MAEISKTEEKSKIKSIMEWVYCFLIAIVLVLIIKTFIGVPTVVKQKSMYPTLKQEERLWLNRWGATLNQMPKRGEIITFEAPTTSYVIRTEADLENPVAKYDYKPSNIISSFKYNVLEIGKVSYIKRVIGLPGERVTIKDGKVYINGEELKEDYLQDYIVTESLEGAFTDIVVPENCVYAMGDNRPESTDSRRFGCIPLEKIESVAVLRFWPFDKFGTI